MFLSKKGDILLYILASSLAVRDTESFDCTAGHLAEGMNWTKDIEVPVCAATVWLKKAGCC
jgi:hypothetical protein